jgi:hypothetical protein
MTNLSGSMTINGIGDVELRGIWGIKIKREKSLVFNPQQLQPVADQRNSQARATGAMQTQHYNNALFAWQADDGLEAVHQIISMPLKKEEHYEKPSGLQ